MSYELAKPRLLTVVVNEKSGGGRARRLLPQVVTTLREHMPNCEVQVQRSTSFVDAELMLRSAALAARDGDAVLAMGGDGMAHLGLNACAGTEATLGIVPAGTGNDFARGIGLPRSVPDAVRAVTEQATRTIDLIKISNARFPSRHVGAVVSTGYDARVNRATNETKLRFGALSYGIVALKELARFSPLHYTMVADGKTATFEAMLVAVSNTGIFGGGMRVAPDADPGDGLLDVTVIHPVSRTLLLRLLPELYSGKFVRHRAVEQFRVKSITLDGSELFVMGDGEELGEVPVSMATDPGALRVFVPAATVDG